MKPRIRLAVYSPDPDEHRITYVGGAMADTPDNRAWAKGIIEAFDQLSDGDYSVSLCLGVFQVSARTGKVA